MEKVTSSRPFHEAPTICFLNPALMPGWFWLPTAHYVQQKGFSYVIPDVLREKTDVSIKQNVDIIEQSLSGQGKHYLVALSRGVEYAVRYIDRMSKQGKLDKIVGWTVLSSVGPRGYESVIEAESRPMSRHTPGYSRGIKLDKNGLEFIDKTVAVSTLLHDVSDPRLCAQTLKDMIRNRPLADTEISAVPRLRQGTLPLTWYIGLHDKVDNTELSAQVAHQKFGVEAKYVEWGHVSPLTNTSGVGDVIIHDALQALI